MTNEQMKKEHAALTAINEDQHRQIHEAHRILSKYCAEENGRLPERIETFCKAALKLRRADRHPGC